MEETDLTSTIKKVPQVVSYVQLDLSALDYEIYHHREKDLSRSLANTILSQIQGEAVEVSEEHPIPVLMAVFTLAYKVSPELILRTKSGRKVLIFEHWADPVIRSKDIEVIKIGDNFDNADIVEDENSSISLPDELAINLQSLWGRYNNLDDELEAILKALEEVKKKIRPAMAIKLVGKAPALLFLLVQRLLVGETAEIWYQENLSTQPIRITRL